MLHVGLQGVKVTVERPNPYLYQSLAVLAAEMGLLEESRKWFMKGTRTLVVRPSGAPGRTTDRAEPHWARCPRGMTVPG